MTSHAVVLDGAGLVVFRFLRLPSGTTSRVLLTDAPTSVAATPMADARGGHGSSATTHAGDGVGLGGGLGGAVGGGGPTGQHELLMSGDTYATLEHTLSTQEALSVERAGMFLLDHVNVRPPCPRRSFTLNQP